MTPKNISRLADRKQLRCQWLAVMVILALMSSAGRAQSGGIYTLTWSTLDGGGAGAGASSGGAYTVAGTIGQPDASATSLLGGAYSLLGGFWSMPRCVAGLRADFDLDCDVDLQDFDILAGCGSGPHLPYDPAALPEACTLAPDASNRIAADLDADGDVDQVDFALFQTQFTAAGR